MNHPKSMIEALPTGSHLLSEITANGFALGEITDDQLETAEFEILRTGEFYDHRYGKFAVKENLLQQLADNFNNGVYGVDVAVDVNHESEKGAIAWMRPGSATVRNGKLYAQLKDFTSEGKQKLKEKVYKYFSVEFAPFETVQNGKKLTVPNVIKGLAVTNRPVIKGMAPTFLSENFNRNPSFMNPFKVFATALLAEAKISKKDFSRLEAMYATLSEEEKTEAQADVDAAKAKVEEEKPADATPAPAPAPAPAPTDANLAEKVKDMDVKLSQALSENAALKLAEEKRQVDAAVEDLMLSEASPVGFTATEENKKKLSEFIGELSQAQRVTFGELVKSITVFDTKKLGEDGSGDGVSDKSIDAKLAEAKQKATEMMKEKGISLSTALSEVYHQMGLTQ